MEADKFDRLMAEKLGQADVPQYSESKWASFHSRLPSSGFGMSWTSLGLALLLILSNAWWIWNFAGEQNEITVPDPPVQASKGELAERDKPVIDRRTVTVYDTVHRIVEVERIVYVNVVREDLAENGSTSLTNNESTEASDKSDTRIDGTPVAGSEAIAGKKEVLTSEAGHQGAVSAADSLEVGEDEVRESTMTESTEPDKEKQRTPYAGPRWFIGINGQKPFRAGKQEEFSGAGPGVNLEYMPAGWLALIAEANFLNYDYVIQDAAFYEKMRESSDPDLYEPGGIYGSGYSWEQSEVNKSTVQAGMFFKLSNPAKSGIRPFVSSGYVIELHAKTDVTNKLIESGTNKVVRVESFMPGDPQNQYIRSEIGVESQLKNSFWLRLSVDHWMQVSGSPYEGDWIGAKVVIIYGLR